MKKTFLTLTAVIAMLFAFSSCEDLLNTLSNLEEQGQNNTEQKTDENDPAETGDTSGDSSIKGIADLTGKSFVYYEDSFQNQYIYFKDASTVVFCLKDSSGNWKTEECSINENGRFDSKILKHSVTVKVIDGNVLFYKNQINADGIDENANVKKDGSEGLVGIWVYSGYADPFEYTVTEKTISLDDVVTKDYTYKNGILYVDGKVGYYYDGKNLYTEGVKSPEKVSDTALETEIKKQAGVKDKDDEGGTESATIKIDDVVGNVYFLQSNPDSTINDIQVNLYHVDNLTTITQFYRNSSYYDNDLLIKEWTNNIQENGMDFSYSYYDGDQNHISTDAKTLNYAIYDNSIILYDTGDSFPLTKTSGGDGLYGTWEVTFEYYKWGEYWPETVKLEIDESTANSEKYTNENGFITIKHGEGWNASYESFYYDGKTVYREPYKLAKVTDLRKIRAIKSSGLAIYLLIIYKNGDRADFAGGVHMSFEKESIVFDWVNHLKDLNVETKKMFGCYCVYCDGQAVG